MAAWLAVAGLMFRVILGAWHVHPLPIAAGGTPVVASAATPAHGPGKHDALIHGCDLCQTLQSASALAGVEAPALLPPRGDELRLLASSAAPVAAPPALGFRSRAPPLA
jgi:hypothetical protein